MIAQNLSSLSLLASHFTLAVQKMQVFVDDPLFVCKIKREIGR